MSVPAIPSRPESVTADWMTEALSTAIPGTELAAVDVVEQHTGTTGRMRLGLRYAPTSADGPESVFVKLAPFDESQQKLVASVDMGRREARFYASLAAEAPIRTPAPFHAAHGERPTEYVMVLEDLEASGCTFTTRADTAVGDRAEEHGEKLIESLGRLHAHFWEDPRFDDELSWVRPAMRGSYGAVLVASARDQFADQLPPVFAELCDLYVEHDSAIVELWDEGEKTLVHGDTHSGNQFVDGGHVGLYDWAVISRSPGVRDLGIYLGNSCPAQVREANQDAWLHAYHRVLVDAGVDAPTFDELWLRYRRTVLYAWVAATTTASMGSKWQPIEIGMLGMQRATQACADLDTLGAFRESL